MLSDAVALPSQPKMTSLYLSGSPISSLSLGAVQPAMNSLFAEDANLLSLQSLSATELPALRTLTVRNNPLGSAEGIQVLETLRDVNVGLCGLTDLGPFKDLSSLEYLGADSNELTDLSPVSHVASLAVGDNLLTTLAPLVGGPARELLDVRNNLISDYLEITNVTYEECAWVWFSGNPGLDEDLLTQGMCASMIIVEGNCNTNECGF